MKNKKIQRWCPCLTFLTSANAISSMSFLFSDILALDRGKALRAAAVAAAVTGTAPAAKAAAKKEEKKPVKKK